MNAKPNGPTDLLFEDVMVGRPPPLKVGYTTVPIDDLDLDPDNPRLRYRQAIDGTKSASDILFEDQDTKHLKEDIKQNGLFERPFVRRSGNGRFVAFEGNRRLACYKVLHAEDPTNPQWQSMPVRILPDDATPIQRGLMLAQFHVAGKLKWNAHERAGHIYELSEVLKVPDDTIKVALHIGKPAIDKAVAAYRMLMEHFVTVDGGRFRDKAEGKYSFFAEFQKKKDFRDLAKSDSFFVDDFCRWVGEERIPRSEDVRQLPAILSDTKAKHAFLEHAPKDAYRLALETVQTANAAMKSTFFKQLRETIKAGNKATVKDFATAASPSGRQMLSDARAVLELINRHADNPR